MHTPITGDSPAERALEVQQQALLNEHAHLAEQQRVVEELVRDQAESSRQHRQPSPTTRWRGLNINNSFIARGVAPPPVYRTPVQNLIVATALVGAMPLPADDDPMVANYRQILALMKAVVE